MVLVHIACIAAVLLGVVVLGRSKQVDAEPDESTECPECGGVLYHDRIEGQTKCLRCGKEQ
jgi:hypothetical protein